MSVILSIETASKTCSVAIHQAGVLLSYDETVIEKSHSRVLLSLINNQLNSIKLPIQAVDVIAVSKGPGSYTGLRIGVSSAKGLAYALNKPIIAVNTLESIAKQLTAQATANHLICPMLDARRMEVYCALFNSQLKYIEPTQAKIIDETSFLQQLDTHTILFAGDGAEKCKPLLQHKNAIFVESINPSAKSIGEIAAKLFQEQKFEDIAYFEPYYLKDFMSTGIKQ